MGRRTSINTDTLPAGRVRSVELPATLERVLSRGHPWVYRNQVPSGFDAAMGEFVRARAGRASFYGVWDAKSAVALRIFSSKGVPDAAWFEERIGEAWELRARIRESGTNAYRLVAGEGDGLPGIVADVYDETCVVVVDSPSLEPLLPWVTGALRRVGSMKAVARRLRHANVSERLSPLLGREPPGEVIVEENGILFAVDLRAGQKTGLFLDQRENRTFVERIAKGRRVLNLFGYTGGFSLYAARGGAEHTTTVDVAAEAIDAARKNFALNGHDASRHEFVVSDVFEYLDGANRAGRRFDLVVCDPPSFGRKRDQLDTALAAYSKLHAAALGVTARGGIYAAGSCTSRVTPEALREALAAAAASARCRLQVIHDAGHAEDHPIFAGHPEGRYLKFIVSRVLTLA